MINYISGFDLYFQSILFRLFKNILRKKSFVFHSESNESQILAKYLNYIDYKSFSFLDIGAGGGFHGSNTIDLLINKGFRGLFVEGDSSNAYKLKTLLESNADIERCNYEVLNEFVTSENINSICFKVDGFKNIDVVSIDIDSVDFWVWKALHVIKPFIVIVEFQCIFKEDQFLVSPNFARSGFVNRNGHEYCISNSASLSAFVKLGNEKGYTLVAVSESGFNAFFMINEIAERHHLGISVAEGLDRDFTRWAQREFGEEIMCFEWLKY